MILSVSQPYFFPFPGFFYKAYLSDIFVILDDVQFPRGTTWITRNRFKNDQGSLWLTVPVKKKGMGFQQIDAVKICHDGRWPKKHLESLKNAYSRAPYFKEHMGFLEALWSTKFEKLIDLNLKVIQYLMQQLEVDTKIVLSSELGIRSTGNTLLIEICREMRVSRFLAQSAAQKYLDADRFSDAGIRLIQFKPLVLIYPQLWGSFIPNLSALDLVFNCGPKGHDIMTGG